VEIFQVALIVATFLCTLVAGFVFAFAVVVMPGIRTLGDGEFLRAFQVMDRVIQNNQPVFMLVWLGSVIALLASAARREFESRWNSSNSTRTVLASLVSVWLMILLLRV
jgi:uncharacterized membrane protein